MTIPERWLNLLKRLMGLKPGRYIIILTVQGDGCDWTVIPAGKVER